MNDKISDLICNVINWFFDIDWLNVWIVFLFIILDISIFMLFYTLKMKGSFI